MPSLPFPKRRAVLTLDFSLTNYAQVQRQLPSGKKLAEVEKLRQDGNEKWKSVLKKHCKGPLFEVDWFRVVLDEAHYLNNRDSKSKSSSYSISCGKIYSTK